MDKTLLKRSDYINSTIGWIPEQWEIQKLDEIGIFLKGKGISKSEILKEGFPCITYGEIYTEHDFIIKSFNSHIDEKSSKKSIKLNYGDILFAGSGETLEDIGKCVAFVDKFKAFAGGDIIILRQSHHIPEYLGYLLNQDFVNKQKYRFGQGHSVVHIYSSSLRNIFISLPPIAEQQKIARILRTCDMAIETTEKLITKKRERKKGLMQQLLTGKRRFLEFVKSDKMHDTKLGMIPEDWDIRKLKNIACIDKESLGNGISPDYKFTYISLSDIDNGKIISNKLPVLNYSNSPSRARRVVHIGDILLANVRPNLLGYYIFNKEVNNTIVSTGFSVITPKEKISGDFIYQYLYSSIFQRQLHGLIVGSNYPAINSYVVKSLKIPLPDYFEQQKIASVLSTADNEIEYLQNQLEKLKEQKKGLMQKLLTGEVRVRLN